jgi:hypothetical protein
MFKIIVTILLIMLTFNLYSQMEDRGTAILERLGDVEIRLSTKYLDGTMYFLVHCSPLTGIFLERFDKGVYFCLKRKKNKNNNDLMRSLDDMFLGDNEMFKAMSRDLRRKEQSKEDECFKFTFIDYDGFEILTIICPIIDMHNGVVDSVNLKNSKYYRGSVKCSKIMYDSFYTWSVSWNF